MISDDIWNPNDLGFDPKLPGIPHHAAARPVPEPSLHLAIALHRRPMALSSIVGAMLTLQRLVAWLVQHRTGCWCGTQGMFHKKFASSWYCSYVYIKIDDCLYRPYIILYLSREISMFPCIAVKSYQIVHGCNACFYVFFVLLPFRKGQFLHVFHMSSTWNRQASLQNPFLTCRHWWFRIQRTSICLGCLLVCLNMIEYDWYIFMNMLHMFIHFEELFKANFIQIFGWDKDPGSDDMLPATLLKTQRFTTEKLWCDMWVSCFHHVKPLYDDYAFWLVAFGNRIRMKQQESRVDWALLAPECSTSRSLEPIYEASVVEEMESRSQCFAAFGAREHWLNQLLPMHLPLASWNQEGIQWHSVVVSWNMLEWWEGTSTIFNLMHCPVSFVSLMYASANVYHFVGFCPCHSKSPQVDLVPDSMQGSSPGSRRCWDRRCWWDLVMT